MRPTTHDRREGAALRLLREALPGHLVRILEWEDTGGVWHVSVSTEGPAVYRRRRERHQGDALTLEGALTACLTDAVLEEFG